MALVGLFAGALNAVGCGPEPEAPSAEVPHRTSFFDVGVQALELDGSVQELAAYRLTSNEPKLNRFQVDQGQPRMSPLRGTGPQGARFAYGARLQGGPLMMSLPLDAFGAPGVAASMTTIEAEVYCPGVGELKLSATLLDDRGKLLGTTDFQLFWRKKTPTKVVLELPRNQKLEGAASIKFRFSGRAGPVSMAAVELRRSPPGSELPRLSTPELITLRGQSRHAGGLVEGHPWEGTFLGRADSFMRLSVHTPLRYALGVGYIAKLRVDIEAGGKSRTLIVPMPSETRATWHDVKLPLELKQPSEVTVRLTCADDRDSVDSVLLVGDAAVVTPKPDPKTVLLITSDTHRADYLGVARGKASVMTPAIDDLATRGVWFRDCQSTINTTTPSHVAIMTGLHPKDTGIVDNVTRMSERASTLAEAFRGAGFRTIGAVGAPHLVPSWTGLGQGFDRFSDPVGGVRAASKSIESLMEALDDASGEDTFLWLHLFDAHSPYDPPNRTSGVASGAPAIEITADLLEVKQVPSWLQEVETTGLDEVRGWYGEEVEALDRSLAELFDHTRVQSGWVAFTSDHGENLGEHRAWFKHSGLFLPVLQVPLIIAGPGIEPRVSDAQVQQSSVGRTLLDLLSIDVDFPGKNLLEAGSADEPRFALGSNGTQASICVGKWLLLLGLRTVDSNPGEPFYLAGRVQLFDRTLGISTEEDFVDAEPEIAKKLRASLVKWLESGPELQPLAETIEVTDAERKDLEELGYSGGGEGPVDKWWSESRITDTRWKGAF